MRVAALVKQVPKFEAMELGHDGRLVREGLELELNPYCRRAVAKAVELARETGGTSTVFTLGPPPAEDCLREAVAWGIDDGVLITDRAINNDQGQKIVYVVNEKNEVAARPVRTGALHDGLREITDGLQPGERIVVNGLQQVRPGMTAEPQIVQMPGQKAPATIEPSAPSVHRALARVGHER